MRWHRTASLSFLLVFGCDVYHPEAFDNYDAGSDAEIGDAALDAGFDAGPMDAGFDAGATDAGFDGGPEVCVSRVPPPRPVGGEDGAQMFFALRNIVLEQASPAWNDLGYDLDDVCTVSVSTTTCEPRGGASPALDGLDGVDNATGREILIGLTIGNPGFQPAARAQQDLGISGMMLHRAGYDGSENDSLVAAALSQTLWAEPMGGNRWDTLNWDGTDTFYISDRDFVDGDPTMPLIVDTAAYVNGRTLVMHLPEGRTIYIPWSSNPMEIRLTDAVLVADISEDLMQVDNVRIAGRWALVDISRSLTQVGQCPGESDRATIDSLIERVADVRSDESTDSMGFACDALSFAVGFDGTRALLGGTLPVPPIVDLCSPP